MISGGIKSVLVVPMFSQTDYLGVIVFINLNDDNAFENIDITQILTIIQKNISRFIAETILRKRINQVQRTSGKCVKIKNYIFGEYGA